LVEAKRALPSSNFLLQLCVRPLASLTRTHCRMQVLCKFVVARKNKTPVSNVVRIGTRIKSGETGILISGIAMLLLLAALIYLSYTGGISQSNTIVLFFGLRMQNSNFSNISTGLMRFARALTHSE
jgi:hypothetical protein